MLRRFAGFVVIAGVGAAAACSTAYTSAPEPDEPDATGAANDAASAALDAESGALDAGSVLPGCEDFDAAPLPTARYVDCDGSGTMRDLYSDPDNCGYCGHVCDCDGAGRCAVRTLYEAPTKAPLVLDAVASGFAYYHQGNTAYSVFGTGADPHPSQLGTALDGGADTTLVQVLPAAGSIYFREYGNVALVTLNNQSVAAVGAPGLAAYSLDGVVVTERDVGRVTVFDTTLENGKRFDGQPGANDLAASPDGTRTFWIARGNAEAGVSATLSSLSLGALSALGEVTPDPSTSGNMLAADNSVLYLAGPNSEISAQPLDATQVAFLRVAAPVAGSRTIALAADDSRVYWLAAVAGSDRADLFSVSHCGGPVIRHVAAGDTTQLPSGLAVDAQYIYWSAGPSVVYVPK